MATKRRDDDDDGTTIAAASEVDPNVDVETRESGPLPASSPQRLSSSSSRSNATNADDGNVVVVVLGGVFEIPLLRADRGVVHLLRGLVGRSSGRSETFFGWESGVGAATLLGEEEPTDLIDTRTGKLDLNLRHISKRKHEHVETIEEHNEKALIDRVGLEKAEEIEEEEEEKEGAEVALQIERSAREKREGRRSLESGERGKEENRRKKERIKKKRRRGEGSSRERKERWR